MNLQRREEIRAIAREFRRLFLHEQAEAIDELLAHIDTLEQAAAERVIVDGGRGLGVALAVVVPELTRRQSTDIANEAQMITGRSIWPSTVEAIAKVMHSRAIPADRVLGEGEGLNKKIREAYMEGHFDGVQWSGQDEEDANKEADWQASSALHAIRANQGGAAT